MRVIISPAKRMRRDEDSLPWLDLPRFLPQAEQLMEALRQMTPEQLRHLWRCNEAIAAENVERLREMDLRRHLTPAVLSFDGIQYQYMAPGVLEEKQLAFLQEHLRILSGFYGVLRPFDGVAPYRLEMQAKLSVSGSKDLYAFWGSRLAEALARETDWVLNLASREYSRAVSPFLPSSTRFLTCVFGEKREGRIVEKGTLCKMARGRMVRWLAAEGIRRPEAVRDFQELGYRCIPEESSADCLVFLRGSGATPAR